MANYISKYTGAQIDKAVGDVLNGNVGGTGGGGNITIDDTLTKAGAAADAKATGDRLTALSEEIEEIKAANVGGPVTITFTEDEIINDAFVRPDNGMTSVTAAKYHCVDYVSLKIFKPNTPITVRCAIIGNCSLAFYDGTREVMFIISGSNAAEYGITPSRTMQYITLTPPEGAAYIRFGANSESDKGGDYTSASDFRIEGESTSGNESRISAVENKINANLTNISDLKVLVIGDSISADYYASYPKWVTHLTEIGFFGLDNITNDSIHATGFVARYNNEANDFIARLAAVTDPETYDMVVVFGGINDYIQGIPMGESGGDKTANFKPAVDDFFATLAEMFVGARIAVLTPLRTKNYNSNNKAGHKQSDYADYIKTVAQTYALPVLDLMNHSGFHPEHETFRQRWTFKNWSGGDGTQGDGTHPIEEYERKYLAPMIRHFLQGLL